MSCPDGIQLDLLIGKNVQDDKDMEFEMVDELNGDKFFVEDSAKDMLNDINVPKNGTGVTQISELAKITKQDGERSGSSPKNKRLPAQTDLRRFRSQSENITACTIFKFLESRTLLKN